MACSKATTISAPRAATLSVYCSQGVNKTTVEASYTATIKTSLITSILAQIQYRYRELEIELHLDIGY